MMPKVAIIGAGPAGFYTAQALLAEGACTVDLFDRLPTPFGLVRFGVAPDHQKIKSVTRVYDKIAASPGFRFFGGVDFGVDLDLVDLRRFYHQIVFTTGAQTDRRLGIPGEDLIRSHPATEFVAWYNGHPDFQDRKFDLKGHAAVVIGVGNVAVDVARILSKTHDELASTDITEQALRTLDAGSVRHVHLLGRRGPAQAAFTNPEVKELGELDDTYPEVHADELELDPASLARVASDRGTARKVEILRSFLDTDRRSRSRVLTFRFQVSPVEILDDGKGGVAGVRICRNELVEEAGGRVRSVATERTEDLPAHIVFRSVGYRGVPLKGVPFRDDWGTVPNLAGRVLDRVDGSPVSGLYVAGWIKRGPSGVIGTNKPDGVETARSLLEDVPTAGWPEGSVEPDENAVIRFLDDQGVRVFTYQDWDRIDRLEQARGNEIGRPRIKLTKTEEFFEGLDSE